MKSFFTAIANFFAKYGLLKIIIAFIILIISVLILNGNTYPIIQTIFKWLGLLSITYLILAFIIFLIVGIINSFKKL